MPSNLHTRSRVLLQGTGTGVGGGPADFRKLLSGKAKWGGRFGLVTLGHRHIHLLGAEWEVPKVGCGRRESGADGTGTLGARGQGRPGGSGMGAAASKGKHSDSLAPRCSPPNPTAHPACCRRVCAHDGRRVPPLLNFCSAPQPPRSSWRLAAWWSWRAASTCCS